MKNFSFDLFTSTPGTISVCTNNALRWIGKGALSIFVIGSINVIQAVSPMYCLRIWTPLQITKYMILDPRKASQWVKDHVIGYLKRCPNAKAIHGRDGLYYIDRADHKNGQCTFADPSKGIIGAYADCPWRTREQIKAEILNFMDIEKYGKPELWGYYSAYDHVAFCQLFGTMMDLPPNFPMYTRDIKQWCDALGNPNLPEQGKGEHNALADARWNKIAW